VLCAGEGVGGDGWSRYGVTQRERGDQELSNVPLLKLALNSLKLRRPQYHS